MPTLQARGWVFTINNYCDAEVDRVKQVPCLKIICGKEVGKSGTPHLQGAVWFKQKLSRKAVLALIGERAYVHPMDGKWHEQTYCAKDGELVRMEDNSKQGSRTDLHAFADAIKRKAPDEELFRDHLSCVAKYPRLESRLKASFLKQSTREFRKIEVIVHWGDAGTGKTRKPYEEGAYVFDDYEHGWWDGYDGEPVILLDDFYGGIKWSYFLRLLDGYQCRLKVKGGFTYAQWTKIYITSNKHPSEWYKHFEGVVPPELKRRITNTIHFDLSLFKKPV